ncbi:GyrI-like domain-containing protein [Flavobacterium sp. Sd200]|uniref:GyrI-like domain-containing protein n=1 Tax=Flavobacterium sp. Sd200 TaxID=2692211 RepID=UPI0013700560|nr:GyrI-like domain-containing protein [Flavobacterium sp. Sd200]MXN93288.1 GyrI-like domain-containing protein [Flavobacterium sp. Sd200]
MNPEITTRAETFLIGKKQIMSLANNTTQSLWASFMPLLSTIPNRLGVDRYSVQIYPENYFINFNPVTVFEKWAAVEVNSQKDIPIGMEVLTVPEGLYAVFHYKGNPSNGAEVFKEIFTVWLPQSGYSLDNRSHFEVLGDKYRNASDDSEEEIWIPIK